MDDISVDAGVVVENLSHSRRGIGFWKGNNLVLLVVVIVGVSLLVLLVAVLTEEEDRLLFLGVQDR